MSSTAQRAAEAAQHLAREAAFLAANLQGQVEVRDKGGSEGPVTEADLAVEKLVLDGLRRAFPTDSILSEETSTDIDTSAPRIWCVDPIDGTREYADGLDEYAVQIGLLEDGVPVAGAIALPGRGQIFLGYRGGPCELIESGGRRTIHLGAVAGLDAAVAIHSRSHPSQDLADSLDRLGVAERIAAGSVGYKVAQILLGKAHLYLHRGHGTKWWDSVGPAAVLQAAGGSVTDGFGVPLAFVGDPQHRDGLFFAAPTLEAAAVEKLRA